MDNTNNYIQYTHVHTMYTTLIQEKGLQEHKNKSRCPNSTQDYLERH